jgi:hypothetical protein
MLLKPRIVPRPNPKRLREGRPRSMTLIAAFRCPKGGVLLCADREEDDGYNKREVDKLYRIMHQELVSCDVWLAGSGSGDLIRKFRAQLHGSLIAAVQRGHDVFDDHEKLIQKELADFYRQWNSDIKKSNGLQFIVVIAPLRPDRVPILYRTSATALIPYPEYCATGSGQPIADYLADRLSTYGSLESRATGLMAAFIFREAQGSAIGVGFGADMVFIHEGGKSRYWIPAARVKELEACIPALGDCILGWWPENTVTPEWYKDW